MNYSSKFDALNPSNSPMVESDFYHWMEQGGYANNIIQNKVNYLRSKGFQRGRDTVSAKTLRTLGYIHSEYFRQVVLPRMYRPYI